ncbi:Uma2 family endonuclease [Acaryochloris sp. IP29b_bin.148]|uniref:Uma2 family endonuclease n=1 Tax=Acaryochloris sp. IP29b_bin.148 TaxID=2969218 RepID=UPI0026235A35|nr:Uma2 family endonuclease [Acaryochloris sp. IP29b_bin.148]
MTTLIPTDSAQIYPDSDGQPMADHTKQFRWIVTIKENLEILFTDNPQVFIAGDLLWYPVQGRSDICVAPDIMVVFERPKGDRGSYKQWEEDNITPQVVFEILSPGNTVIEISRKLLFYEHYGVSEYYLYDPDQVSLGGFMRNDQDALVEIPNLEGWISPRLNIRFEIENTDLVIYRPDGEKFLTPVELYDRAEQERERAESAEAKTQRLAARLRELGVDPDAV